MSKPVWADRDTICSECKNIRWYPHALSAVIASQPARCAAVRENFVFAGVAGFALCSKVNTEGRCDKFEAKPPAPASVPWWRRLLRFA